ncbi:MAG: zinc ribbon domain-containing protein [Lachnoclostridium sp.]|nr:zinc ribbon domain-containing protein [Lachnospira sp.]MCM1246937.1 zinc ribbon domain-containing protein [Lachnoclostridium sp.]
MFCGQCGAEVKDEAAFCPKCGARRNIALQREMLQQEEAAEPAAGQVQGAGVPGGLPSGNAPSKKKGIPIGGIVAVIAAGLAAVAAVAVIVVLSATGGHLKHEWEDATCTEPETCAICGKTRGEPLGHTAQEATCTEPSVCEVCGEKLAEPLGHTVLAEATCTEPSVCSVCNATLKKALGHTWTKATCKEPKTCRVCGTQEGGLGEHTPGAAATYWKASVCSLCGASVGEPLTPAFEREGIKINAFSGGTYSYQTVSEAGNKTVGQASFKEGSESTGGDGFSTVRGSIQIKFTDSEARMRGSRIVYGISDYYLAGNFNNRKENTTDGATYYFSVDYNGKSYSGCYGQLSLSYERPGITASVQGPELWWTVAYEFYLPTGYDGCVICLFDGAQSNVSLRDAELLFRVQ